MKKFIQSPPLKEAWIRRRKYEFAKEDLSFFPSDSLGARGEEERLLNYPRAGEPISLVYSSGEWSGDIAVRKSGVSRPRDHQQMKALIEKAKKGDVVRLSEIGPRRYKVELISADDGRTIL